MSSDSTHSTHSKHPFQWWKPLLKYSISLALLVWLCTRESTQQAFQTLWKQPLDWSWMVFAIVLATSGFSISIIRWYWLVRALELPFTLKEAFRLGFMGHLLTFVSIGAAGGDLFKAFFIAKDQTSRRAEAVATIFVDRVMGLLALFVIASIAAWGLDLADHSLPAIRSITYIAWTVSGLGILGVAIVLLPGFSTGPFAEFLISRPKVGKLFHRMITALRMYRKRWAVILLCFVASLANHLLLAASMWCIILGLPGDKPGWGLHFVVMPLALLSAALPLPGGGLGIFEPAVATLYSQLAEYPLGIVAAFVFRAITILLAFVGLIFYLTSGKDVTHAIEEAEEAEEADELAEENQANDSHLDDSLPSELSAESKI